MCTAIGPFPLLLAASLALGGCAGRGWTGSAFGAKVGGGDSSHVELTLKNVSAAQAPRLVGELEAQGLKNVRLKQHAGGAAVYELDIDGCECDVPKKVAQIKSLGFKYQGRWSQVVFDTFDVQPPRLSFHQPKADEVVKEQFVLVFLDIPDDDVAEVAVNGERADRYQGSLFRTQVRLKDGVHELVATATDRSGNKSELKRRIAVDTSGPLHKAEVKVVVEGQVAPGSTVSIAGTPVAVDSQGRYRTEVPVTAGQREVEILATDPQGNQKKLQKVLGE